MDYISRDQNPQFSQPLSQIITMLAIVAGVVGLGYLAYPSVGPTVLANPYLNIFILLVFVIGVATCFYQVLSLIYSVQWIEGFVSQRDGFEEVKPMVFAGIYPVDTEEFEELRSSMEKLQLNDASLVFTPESSSALGFGFRCGFLGMLHLEIIQERLEREFNMSVITTVPNVSYQAFTRKNPEQSILVNNPSDLPDPSSLDRVEEPYIKAAIITKSDYVGNVMSLCIEKRGVIQNQTYLTTQRVELLFDMPLAEIVFDFYDRLKTVSKGYASFDYSPIGLRKSKLVKVDLLLNGSSVDALSALIHFDSAYTIGKKMCEKLRELIPRQQFDIPIQAAIGAKIISRETIKALRKDVTAKCYGGDISRKRKLLEKQKKGKKKMRQIGNVEIPQEAFMAVLKLND
jgi:GTP-binding protein LepA